MDIELRLRDFLVTISAALVQLPRPAKKVLLIVCDLLSLTFSVWIAYYLRIGEWISLFYQTEEHRPFILLLFGLCFVVPLLYWRGAYNIVTRHYDASSLQTIYVALGLFGVLAVFSFTIIGVAGVPRTVGIIQPCILYFLISMNRVAVRHFLGVKPRREAVDGSRESNVLIYGAGLAGRELAKQLSVIDEIKVVGFVDDDQSLHGSLSNNILVHPQYEISDLIKRNKIDEILVAIPSLGAKRMAEILAELQKYDVPIKTLPSLRDLVNGKFSVSDVRSLSTDEMLGREVVLPNTELMKADISKSVVLVTGAGGSIGSELCRQIVQQTPSILLLFESNEFALYSIEAELVRMKSILGLGEDIKIIPILGSVTDKARLNYVFSSYEVRTVYHAAAYKHVPLVEDNIIEGLKNNVFGTLNVARRAAEFSVAKFVLISTDKAVRPTSVMGASKRIAEMGLQCGAAELQNTQFAIVRFGNVLGSSGSVVPLFRSQIARGGPITLTHPEVVRYFMTITEASQLVIQAGAVFNPPDTLEKPSVPVFLLDMGEPVKIKDLAEKMVAAAGLTIFDGIDGDIEIVTTGLRPGEKLFEELLIGNDSSKTSHPKIFVANEEHLAEQPMNDLIARLEQGINNADDDALRNVLAEMFPTLGQQQITGVQPH